MEKYKLLIVDDDAAIIKVLTRVLADEYLLTTTTDPTNALKLLETNTPDIILADLHMGELTGVDVFKKAATLQKKPAMVLMTGTPNVPMPMDLLNELGVYKLLLKPWDIDYLKKTLLEALQARG